MSWRTKFYTAIFPTRFACLPPSNSVFIKTSSIFSASPSLTKRAGMQRIFALLCLRASSASSSPQQIAARTPWCLLAVMATPLALPHNKMPKAASPFSTAESYLIGLIFIWNCKQYLNLSLLI